MSPGSEPAQESAPAGETAPQETASGTGWQPAQGRPTTTLLLRHGQTALSVERRFAGRGDIPLTDLGREQAARAADALAERGGVDAVVTSPLGRARETAEAVARATGAPLAVEEGFAETDFGSWEGLSFGEVMERWPDEMTAWLADAKAAPSGGESFAAVGMRVDAALDRLLDAYQGQKVVVVSHVTPIKTLVCRALLAPTAALFRMHLDVASLTEAAWFADGPALLRSLNDTSHLRETGQLQR
jgi:ribonuclease H / adenosylcobalamin/alpha-ribazole phosphatase